ncbi:MAG: DUF488 family protein [Gaiellaceae bacterium]
MTRNACCKHFGKQSPLTTTSGPEFRGAWVPSGAWRLFVTTPSRPFCWSVSLARRYRERLDAIGAKGLQKCFADISAEHDGRGLVLLCFEKPGQFCHRRVLAEWWEEQTGQHVPELEPHQLRLA